ncbi:MAG: protein with metal dependent protease domain [Capsulimonas sp.]|jgi:Zn-dependent protease|nr:protein with metal dependent protease domain [Capsulimonas sp.]
MLEHIDWTKFAATMLVLVIAITIHEFAHAITADKLGDDIPRLQGRISLNPIDHLDPVGSFMMVASNLTGMGIGWGKPVMTNPRKYKNPHRGSTLVSLAGPVSNLLQALIFAGISRLNEHMHFMVDGSLTDILVYEGVMVNCSLFFFNLIPVPPLDGFQVFLGFFAEKHAISIRNAIQPISLILFMVLIFSHVTDYILWPPTYALAGFLTGWTWQR